MEALSQAHQGERPDLEPADLMALTIRALLHYSISSVSSVKKESAENVEHYFETATITGIVKQLAHDQGGNGVSPKGNSENGSCLMGFHAPIPFLPMSPHPQAPLLLLMEQTTSTPMREGLLH
jgi:hypothetical protein